MAAASVIPVFLCLFAFWIRVYSQNVCSVTVSEGQVARMTFDLKALPTDITLLYLVRTHDVSDVKTNLLECRPNSTTWTCVPVDIHFTSRGPQNDGTLTVEVRDVTKIFGGQYTLNWFQTGGDFESVTCSLTVKTDVAQQNTPSPTEEGQSSSNPAAIAVPVIIVLVIIVVGVLVVLLVPKIRNKVCSLCGRRGTPRKENDPQAAEGGQAERRLLEESVLNESTIANDANKASAGPSNGAGEKTHQRPSTQPAAPATPPLIPPAAPATPAPPPATPAAATPQGGATPSTQPQSPEAAEIEPEDISREETEKRLLSSDQKDGAFLIRRGQGKARVIALAVRRSSTNVTYHLIERENGRYKLVITQNGKPTTLLFDTLSKLKKEVSNAEGLFDMERFRDESST